MTSGAKWDPGCVIRESGSGLTQPRPTLLALPYNPTCMKASNSMDADVKHAASRFIHVWLLRFSKAEQQDPTHTVSEKWKRPNTGKHYLLVLHYIPL